MNWIVIVVSALVVVGFVYGLRFFRKTVAIAETVVDEESPSDVPPDSRAEDETSRKNSRTTV